MKDHTNAAHCFASTPAGYCGVDPSHWPGITVLSGNVDMGQDGLK